MSHFRNKWGTTLKTVLGLGVLIFIVTIGLAIDVRSSVNTDCTHGSGLEISFGFAIGRLDSTARPATETGKKKQQKSFS